MKITLLAFAVLFITSGLVVHAQGTTGCGFLPVDMAAEISLNEPWYCPINQQIYTQWHSELPIAVVVLLIAFGIASMIVMVGIAFKNERVRSFGISEMYEAIASALIVGIFLYVCAVMFGMTPGVFVGSINPYADSLNLMSGTITTAQSLYTSMFNVYDLFRWFSSQYIRYKHGGFDWPVQDLFSYIVLPTTIYFCDPAKAISYFLSDGILALYAEYYILIFFSVAAIPTFIVPGVIFRTFFPTRALGGVMMAIGICFYLIFPTLFALAYYLTSPSVQHTMMSEQAQITRFGGASVAASNAASASSPLASQLNNVQASISSFWLLVLFYPGLIMGVTYEAISQISRFIGGTFRSASKIRGFV